MKIKRLTALLLTGVLAASFTLGGCGSKEVDPETVVDVRYKVGWKYVHVVP